MWKAVKSVVVGHTLTVIIGIVVIVVVVAGIIDFCTGGYTDAYIEASRSLGRKTVNVSKSQFKQQYEEAIQQKEEKEEQVVQTKVDRQSVGSWYMDVPSSIQKIATSSGEYLSSEDGVIKKYNGLPWDVVDGVYFFDARSAVESTLQYIKDSCESDTAGKINDAFKSGLGIGMHAKDLWSNSNYATVRSYNVTGYNNNFTWTNANKPSMGNLSNVGAYVLVDGVKCLPVALAPTAVSRNYNDNFKESTTQWLQRSTVDRELYGYGGKRKIVAVFTEKKSSEYVYIPIACVDAKAHTFPGGVMQTNLNLASSDLTKEDKTVTLNRAMTWAGTNGNHMPTTFKFTDVTDLVGWEWTNYDWDFWTFTGDYGSTYYGYCYANGKIESSTTQSFKSKATGSTSKGFGTFYTTKRYGGELGRSKGEGLWEQTVKVIEAYGWNNYVYNAVDSLMLEGFVVWPVED